MALKSTPASDIDTLRELMYDEAHDAKYYADLACRRSASRAAPLLKELSRDELGHLRRLQAEYFILTGAQYCPCVADINIPANFLEALRERFHAEKAGAEAYLDAAAATSNKRLSELYADISPDEARHAEALAGLIASRMCSG